MVHFIYSNTYYQIYVEHCDFYFKIHDTELIKSNFCSRKYGYLYIKLMS